MTRKSFVPLVALALLAACDISTSPGPSHPYGLVVATTYAGADSGTYEMRPEAAFYSVHSVQLLSSHGAGQYCDVRQYSAQGTGGSLVPTLDAGASLTGSIGVGATKTSMDLPRRSDAYGFISYLAGAMIPVTPGTDSVSVTIPGATGGFPAWSIAGLTVAPFTHAPVADSVDTNGLPVTWSPAGNDSTAMIIELRYAASGSHELNQETYCVVQDDGSFTVPLIYASGWNTTPGDTTIHEVVMTRYRTTTLQQGDAYLQLITSFQNPLLTP